MHRSITNCRVCHGTSLKKYLDLGKMPLVNNLLTSQTQEEPRFPLEVVYCNDCSLSQLSVVVDPNVLFSHYLYRSSVSKTFTDHCFGLAKVAATDLGMKPGDLVIDIASNDGCLLKQFKAHMPGIKPLGVDPAKNLAEIATQEGVPTLPEFWGPALADRIVDKYGHAKIITATNVFAHVDDIDSFVKGVARALAEDGTFIIEVPYLVDQLNNNIFDTIYHEHLSYFLATPMARCLSNHGLHINRIDRLSIHCGSLRVYAQHDRAPDKSVDDLLRAEKEEGYLSFERYRDFPKRVETIKTELTAMIRGLKGQKKRIAGFGASAKGCILMNYCGLNQDDIAFVVDNAREKQGKFMPGCRIPILPRTALDEDMPDYLLVLVWNIFPEIKAETTEFRKRNGQYILPVPAPHVV